MTDQPPAPPPEPEPHYIMIPFEDGRTSIPGNPVIVGLTMPQLLIAGALLHEIGIIAIQSHAVGIVEAMARKSPGIAIPAPGSSYGRKRH